MYDRDVNQDGAQPKYPIESVGNALTVLHVLRARGSVKIGDVVDTLGIARSTAHRMLAILQSHQFVSADEDQGFVVGPALLRLGAAAVSGLAIRGAARPVLNALARSTGETCELAILDGMNVLLVDVVEGTQSLRVVDELGDRAPAHLTAAGKSMLAGLSKSDLDSRYHGYEFEGSTPNAIRSRRSLDQELRGVREHGFAAARMELGAEYVGVAAAIKQPEGFDLASITIALPVLRADEDFASTLGPVVRDAADEIEARLLSALAAGLDAPA